MASNKNKKSGVSIETRVVGYKVNFPKEASNDRDPVTKKKSVAVSNNIEVFHIPVDEETVVAPLPYKMLRDIGFPFLPAVDEPVVETIETVIPVVEEVKEVAPKKIDLHTEEKEPEVIKITIESKPEETKDEVAPKAEKPQASKKA